ncbi:MepB family protein [Macrococcus epidermidis]|uniref:MepB family protein n=1 Tax=Macrococcus epidermidis TaxID=1902580 RepID=UPI001EF22E48|nr:MepB family protein [Macrococcus epidermidis]MCG7419194.1 MepB family protein [Macrococcus epidermidis]
MHSFKIWNKIFEDREIIVEKEDWNKEYEGLHILSGILNFKSRLAKKTPKKQGYFVAIWKKDSLNKNIPFNENDIGDYLVVNILDNNNEGQFVFPVSVLIEKGIIQSKKSKGKMAFRVYPPWVKDLNKTAMVSQKWQTEHFYKMGEYKFNM